jgi:hypothetical protein
MPDIPLEIEGNAQEFRIHLTNVGGPRAFQVDAAGKGELVLSPNVNFLRLRVTNKEGLSILEPLGTGWTVTIEELVKATP